MSIDEAIYSRLSGFSGMSDLLSDRIYPDIKPQDCPLPAITYRRIVDTNFSAMGVDSNVVKTRFQIDVWSATKASGLQVGGLVDSAMRRWSQETPLKIFDTFRLGAVDFYEDDVKQYHIAIDYELNYSDEA